MGILCDTVKSLKSNLGKADVKSWRNEAANLGLAECFAFLDGLNADALRTSCYDGDLKNIEGKLVPLVEAAAVASKDAPAEVQQLATDKQIGEAGKATIAALDQAATTQRAEALVSVISSLERDIRRQIRLRSQTVIDEISADIQAMWAILHPGEAIENVPYPHRERRQGDRHWFEVLWRRTGVATGSRYRRATGIALASVSSWRWRSEKGLTSSTVPRRRRRQLGPEPPRHDRRAAGEGVWWATGDNPDPRSRLVHGAPPAARRKSWVFKALLPYESPVLGIRWSHKTTTFDDARAQLPERPDSAGNDARKIMDVELALIAERLQIRLPYLRGDRNDKRMAHDLLERFVADGKLCFQKRTAKGHETDGSARSLSLADRLLVSWANRASHTFDVVRPEASRLIDACEKAVESSNAHRVARASGSLTRRPRSGSNANAESALAIRKA